MPETIAEALRAAAGRLAPTSDTARLDAELLMAHALGVSRSDLLLGRMRDPAPEAFTGLVERRVAHEPLAHIAGHQEFYGLDLRVTRDTLIPRGDSETLIEAARAHFADRAPERLLDLGTGTGALLLAALSLWPGARGLGLDASEAALAVASGNAGRLGLSPRAAMLRRDWTAPGWREGLGQFDLVLCNPPYVEDAAPLDRSVREYEPARALFAGPEGLDAYRVLIPQLGKLLCEQGVAVFEIGATQAEPVTRIACDSGFDVALHPDLAGRPRALLFT